MKIFLDAHIHTNISPDSSITTSQLLQGATATGLNAIAIVDHDTVEGYRRIKHSALFSDFLIIPGVEITTDLGEVIILGLENVLISKDPYEVVDSARQSGGLIIAPHPFDGRRGSLREKCSLLNVDLIETVNGKSSNDANRQAKEFAKALNVPGIGGSDAHERSQIGIVANMIECEKKIDSVLKELRKGPKILVRARSGRY
jgi:predicted metal-dependent phosphoesterase TrpH